MLTMDDLPIEIVSMILDYALGRNKRALGNLLVVQKRFYTAIKLMPKYCPEKLIEDGYMECVQTIVAYNARKLTNFKRNFKDYIQTKWNDIEIFLYNDYVSARHICPIGCRVHINLREHNNTFVNSINCTDIPTLMEYVKLNPLGSLQPYAIHQNYLNSDIAHCDYFKKLVGHIIDYINACIGEYMQLYTLLSNISTIIKA